MPLTFEEIDDWTRKTGTLEALQGELSQRTTTLSGLQDQLADIRRLEGWEGSAAHAARQSFDPVDDDIAKAAAAVGAVRTQVGETIADLTELNGKISEARAIRQRQRLHHPVQRQYRRSVGSGRQGQRQPCRTAAP